MAKISEMATYARQNPTVRLGVDGYTDSGAWSAHGSSANRRDAEREHALARSTQRGNLMVDSVQSRVTFDLVDEIDGRRTSRANPGT